MKRTIGLILKGAGMGIAEVIPGVSGGTIAFITGIYQELIDTITSFSPKAIRVLREEGLSSFWTHINGTFLLRLLLGMMIGIIIGVVSITHLVETYPEILWAFFFGLIIASAIYIFKKMPKHGTVEFVLIIVGGLIAYYITEITPVDGTRSLGYVFFSGMIAISALILPGISGSFILLLLGMYTIVIPEVKLLLTEPTLDSAMLVGVFSLGCLAGIISFSRLLSYCFHRHQSKTFALLCGFMLGSLNKIWPWRIPEQWISKEGDTYTSLENYPGIVDDLNVLAEGNVLPQDYPTEPYFYLSLVACCVGLALVAFLARNEA